MSIEQMTLFAYDRYEVFECPKPVAAHVMAGKVHTSDVLTCQVAGYGICLLLTGIEIYVCLSDKVIVYNKYGQQTTTMSPRER